MTDLAPFRGAHSPRVQFLATRQKHRGRASTLDSGRILEVSRESHDTAGESPALPSRKKRDEF